MNEARSKLRPATRLLHPAATVLEVAGPAGERPGVPPLLQTAGWIVPDAAGTDAVAEGGGYFYARHGAPNADAVAATLAELEEAEAGLCFASGMAALAGILGCFVPRGGALVCARGIYGATVSLALDLAARQGFEVRQAEAPTPAAVAPLLDEGAALVLVEAISNPLLRVADLDGLGALCRERGVELCVDATFATPILCRAHPRGATLVAHSATKYLGGHGDLCAGVVTGSRERIGRLEPWLRLHGAVLDPFAAWLLSRGLRTLQVRMERQVAGAGIVAAALEEHPRVRRVHYPGLPSHPDHALALRQLDGPGAMVSFEVASGGGEGGSDEHAREAAAARRVYDRLRLFRRVNSLGDVESMVMHPASSSHRGLPATERLRAGIRDALLRLSVGLEDPRDLVEDLEQALAD